MPVISVVFIILFNYNYLNFKFNEFIVLNNIIDNYEVKNWFHHSFKETKSSEKIVKIGIVDGDIDTDHEDLKQTTIHQKKFVSAIHENDIIHGTSVSGVIVGNNNKFGISGISTTNVEIFNAVVMSNGIVSQKDVVSGIYYCIDNNVDIINMSIEFIKYTDELKKALKKASEHNIIVFMANGNGVFRPSNKDADLLNINNVYSVGALDLKNQKSKYNLKGRIPNLYFPGEKIISTSSNNSYDIFNGTSYSTAIATGFLSNYIKESGKEKDKQDITKGAKKILKKYEEERAQLRRHRKIFQRLRF